MGSRACGPRVVVRRLSCATAWNLPRPGVKPMSPALAGGFITTALPGKPIAFYKEPDNECWWAIRIWHNDRKKVTAGKEAWRKTNGTEPFFFFKHNFILILNEKE